MTEAMRQPAPSARRRLRVERRHLLWALAWALLGAGALTGITWSLPHAERLYSYHPDEVFTVFPAVTILQTGDWNPHWFASGNFLHYLTAFAMALVVPFLGEADWLAVGHLVARLLVFGMGAGTVALTYLLGRRAYGRRAGLIAALLLAVAPLLVVLSHYAKEDVPAAFWVTLTLLLTLGLLERRERATAWAWLGVGVVAGVAAGSKYSTGAVLLLPVAAALVAGGRARWWKAPLVFVGGAVGFLICCPFAVLAWEEFKGGMTVEFLHAQAEEAWTLAFRGRGPGWWYYASIGLPVALGWPLYALALAGVGSALRRRRAADGVLLAWVLGYFALVGGAQDSFVRYLLPLAPVLCVLAGTAVDRWLGAGPGPRARLAGALAAIVWLATAAYSATQALQFAAPDPRDQAVSWLQRHEGSVGLVEPPWYRTPAVSPFNGGPVSRPQFDQWQSANPGRLFVTGWVTIELGQRRPQWFILTDLQTMDGLRLGDPQTIHFLEAVDALYEPVAEFRPRWPASLTGIPPEHLPPDWLYPAPVVRVYGLK